MTTLAWIGASVGYVVCGLVTGRVYIAVEQRSGSLLGTEPDAAGFVVILWPPLALYGIIIGLAYALGKLAFLGLGRKG